MGRARGANAIMAAGFETVYGVPPAASAYIRLPFVSSNLGAEQGLITSDLLGQGRAPLDPTYDVVNNDGDVVVPIDEFPLGFWLTLLLGAPVATADTPVAGLTTFAFSSGQLQLPSMSIEIGHPDRPAYSTHYGVRANTLQIQMQRSGLASATIGLIGKGETVAALTSSTGMAGAADGKRFAQASGSISIDGVLMGEVVSANLSYSNGLEKDETIKPDGEINDVDPGMPMVSLGLTTKFADLSIYNKATSGTPVAVALSWAIGQRKLTINLPRLFLPRSKRPITGPGGIQAEFQAQGASVGGVLMTATLINAAPPVAYG